jgi:hypothetical protein
MLALSQRAVANPLILTPRVVLSEEYNSNIFFEEPNFPEYVTRLGLGLGIEYQTRSSATTLNVGTGAVYFAREANATIDLAQAQRGVLSTQYAWSPNLNFSISDGVARTNNARDIGFITGAGGGFLPPPQQQTDPSATNPGGVNVLLPSGSAFTNSFGISAGYLIDPRWSLGLYYSNGFQNYTNPDVKDLTQSWGVQPGYQLTQDFSLGPSFSYTRFNATNAPDGEAYNLSLGSNYRLTELWNVYASAGASLYHPLEAGGSSTRGFANFALGLNRTFETASLTAGVQQQLTPSAGVAGTSNTFGAFLGYQMLLTQLLTGAISTNYNHFDATQTSFNFLTLTTVLSYPLWQNVSAALVYRYTWEDNIQSAPTLPPGVVDANAVRLQVSWSEPWWQFDL